MTKQKFQIAVDGRPVNLSDLRPTSHSPTLNLMVQRLLDASAGFTSAVERAASHINFTPTGYIDMAQGHAAPALRAIRQAYADARAQAVGERQIAADRLDAARSARAPSLSHAAGAAIIAVELGRQLAADPRLRQRLVALAQSDDEPSFADMELIVAACQLPMALTRLQVADLATLRAYLAPTEAEAFHVASEALEYVEQLTGTITQKIASEAQMSMDQVASIAGEAVVQAVAVVSTRPLETLRGADPGEVGPTADTPSDDTPSDDETEPTGNKLDGLTSALVVAA
jgi:hypothetical protein